MALGHPSPSSWIICFPPASKCHPDHRPDSGRVAGLFLDFYSIPLVCLCLHAEVMPSATSTCVYQEKSRSETCSWWKVSVCFCLNPTSLQKLTVILGILLSFQHFTLKTLKPSQSGGDVLARHPHTLCHEVQGRRTPLREPGSLGLCHPVSRLIPVWPDLKHQLLIQSEMQKAGTKETPHQDLVCGPEG